MIFPRLFLRINKIHTIRSSQEGNIEVATLGWALLYLWTLAVITFASGCGFVGNGDQGIEQVLLSPEPETSELSDIRLRTFEVIWETISEHYVYEEHIGDEWQAKHDEYRARIQEVYDSDQFERIIHEMIASFPKGTVTWQSRSERIASNLQDSTVYEGIGAFIAYREGPEPHLVLLSVVSGSPADRSGLASHDSIFAINGEPIDPVTGITVVEKIRGPAGSEVVLLVGSPGEERREISVTRGNISLEEPLKLMFSYQAAQRHGYITFPRGSYFEMGDDFFASLESMNSSGGLQGLIIDLRIASSGAYWPFAALLQLFADGELGELYNREVTDQIHVIGNNFSDSQNLQLILLAGPDTQGLPEIFAAAMQDVGRASVVGLPTHGLVEGIGEFLLPDGSRLFLAVSSYRTRSGREIGLHGIEPDIRVESDWDEVTSDFDPVLLTAIEMLKSTQE